MGCGYSKRQVEEMERLRDAIKSAVKVFMQRFEETGDIRDLESVDVMARKLERLNKILRECKDC